MRHVLRLKDCPGEFLTRRQGELVRSQLVECHARLAPGDVLTIDFSDVDAMAPSFADECFGKFAERVGTQSFRESVSLIGADETIRTLINSVLAGRIAIQGL